MQKRPVLKIDPKTGETVKTYPSLAAAARDIPGAYSANIHAACNGRWPTSYGYRWQYQTEKGKEAFMPDEDRIMQCKRCGEYEYWGEMRWLCGKCLCRNCYRQAYEKMYQIRYRGRDLDGPRPTADDYRRQQAAIRNG